METRAGFRSACVVITSLFSPLLCLADFTRYPSLRQTPGGFFRVNRHMSASVLILETFSSCTPSRSASLSQPSCISLAKTRIRTA